MQAAVAARRDSGLVVLGRTGAAAITTLDDAVARLKAYARAGADALFVPGLKTRGELDRIAAEVKLPLIVAGADESLAGLDYLSARGARIWMAGHQPFAAAVQAIYETGKAVRAGTPPSKLAGIASGDLMAKVTRAPAYDAYVRKFMAGS
jgi:carboxyvinyl-carboxyphosphonate phosphorylmutase